MGDDLWTSTLGPPTSQGETTMGPLDIAYSRRYALRLIGGAIVALPVAIEGREAAASRGWCRTDPVIELRTPDGRRGNQAAIYLSAKLEEYEFNNSSGDIVIEHPKDAKTNKLWEDPNGYLGQGISTNFAINERLRFGRRAMDVRVRVYIPASRNDMAIKLEWAPGPIGWDADGSPLPAPVIASASGYANRWITISSTLPYR
jgi:hypothetical protein